MHWDSHTLQFNGHLSPRLPGVALALVLLCHPMCQGGTDPCCSHSFILGPAQSLPTAPLGNVITEAEVGLFPHPGRGEQH